MYERVVFAAFVSLSLTGIGLSVSPARALDGTQAPVPAPLPLQSFQNPQAAFRAGIEGLRSGDVKSSVEALKYAAAGGQPLAQWKLGKMYAAGDGVQHDDAKAYEYFSQIVDNYDEDAANRREASVVANAFVAVGVYALKGIPAAAIAPDPARALEVFQFAAINFGDADAQYNLARMYLDGPGIPKDPGRATRWLSLAAEKNHVSAQALLGFLIFSGQNGMPRQRARGLMWLTMANEGADAVKDRWIGDLYKDAMAGASDNDRQAAAVYLAEQTRKRN